MIRSHRVVLFMYMAHSISVVHSETLIPFASCGAFSQRVIRSSGVVHSVSLAHSATMVLLTTYDSIKSSGALYEYGSFILLLWCSHPG